MPSRRAGLAILMTVIMVASALAVPTSRSYLEKGAAAAEGALVEILPGFPSSFTTATDLGPLPPQTNLTIGVSLALPDPGSADAYVYSMYTPGSPTYHHALSPDEFRSRFSPSAAAYQAVEDYYAGLGLKTLATHDRLMLGLEGSTAQVSNAFHTGFHNYRLSDGQIVYGSSAPTYVPGWLPIDGITGMTNALAPKPAQISPTELTAAADAWNNTTGPSTTSTWTCTSGTQGCDEPGYYGEYPLFNAGETGAGMSVGIVDAYDSGDTQSQLSSSETSFASGAGLPAPKENFWYPVPHSGNLNTSASSGWGGETDLDQHMVDMTAPGSTIDVTFATDSSFSVYEAVDYLVANNLTQTITMSWGEADVGTMAAPPQSPCLPYYSCNASWDGSYAFLHPVFAEAVAEGITPFAASGDCGAADGTAGVATDYPASDPFVVGVGGTIPNGTGSVYAGETGWSGNGSSCTANTGGGGGGWAPYAQPWWQHGLGQLTKNLRGVPDVSTDSSDGTSQASPMWAGWVAVADQIHGGGLGLIGPSMYSILRNPSAYAADFHDIKTGNNGYQAGLGWDPITGIGTPIASALLPALSRYEPPVHGSLNASLLVSPTTGSAPLTVTMTATATGGLPPYSYDFVPGLYLGEWTGSSTLGYTYTTPGVYDASVVVFDNSGNSSISWPVLVNVGGGALTGTLSASTTTVVVGQKITFTSSATGGTSPYAYTYYYGDGTYGYNATSTNTHIYYSPGVFCPHVSVIDSAATRGGAMAGPVCITVTLSQVSIASFTASPATIPLGGTTYLNVTALGGTPPYSYAYNNLPAGCTSSSTATLACAPSSAGTYNTVTATVTDASSTSATSSPVTFSVSSPGGPAIASFTASPSSIPLGGTAYLNVTATGGSTPYTYVYNNLPTGCTSSNTSSLLCSPSSTGTYNGITVTVTDSSARTATSNPVSFTVGSAPSLAISSFTALPASVPQGGTVYLNVTATGGTPSYTYAYAGLPAGCVSSSTAAYSCVPTASGSYTVTVTVTDSASNTVTGTAAFTVVAPLAVTSFAASPNTIPLGGTTYLNVTATGGTPTYSYVYNNLPAGCTSVSTASLPCAPSAVGTYNTVTVTVTDASSHTVTSNPLTFSVTPGALTISSFTALPSTLYVGDTLYLNLTVSGGTPGYTYAFFNAPTGCSSASSATSTCVPTMVGTWSAIEATVTDSGGHTVQSAPVSVTVKPAPSLPIITSFLASPSTIQVNASTTFTVQVSGGYAPYQYQYSNLPAGCSSSNSPTLTCAPTLPGNYSVSVLVSDLYGQYVSRNTPLVVNPAFPPSIPAVSLFDNVLLWILIAAIAAAVVAAAVLLSRKKKQPGVPPNQPWQGNQYPPQNTWQQPPQYGADQPYQNPYAPPPGQG